MNWMQRFECIQNFQLCERSSSYKVKRWFCTDTRHGKKTSAESAKMLLSACLKWKLAEEGFQMISSANFIFKLFVSKGTSQPPADWRWRGWLGLTTFLSIFYSLSFFSILGSGKIWSKQWFKLTLAYLGHFLGGANNFILPKFNPFLPKFYPARGGGQCVLPRSCTKLFCQPVLPV